MVEPGGGQPRQQEDEEASNQKTARPSFADGENGDEQIGGQEQLDEPAANSQCGRHRPRGEREEERVEEDRVPSSNVGGTEPAEATSGCLVDAGSPPSSRPMT